MISLLSLQVLFREYRKGYRTDKLGQLTVFFRFLIGIRGISFDSTGLLRVIRGR
jgi:hypothetical protein